MLTTMFLFATKTYALTTGVKVGDTNSFTGYCGYVKAFATYSIEIGLLLSFLMVVYAGIRYATSQGNQTILNDAKEILYGVAIGFLLLLLINFVLKFLLGSPSCTRPTADAIDIILAIGARINL